MKTIEDNKLIAEFMGEIQIGDFFAIKQKSYTPDKLKYGTSWDWLMPVVEKCKGNTHDQRLYDNIEKGLRTLDLVRTYRNVIDFIENYNRVNK